MDTMETDEGGSPKFLLREQLLGHNAAARSACVLATGDLVTGGADSVVNRWELSETPTQPSAQATPIFDHDHAVTALTSMPPTAHPPVQRVALSRDPWTDSSESTTRKASWSLDWKATSTA